MPGAKVARHFDIPRLACLSWQPFMHNFNKSLLTKHFGNILNLSLINHVYSYSFHRSCSSRSRHHSLAEFELLSDTETESLCKVICCPRGTLGNPTEGKPPVPNHGHAVSLQAENNLKLMCYLLHFKTCTSHTLSAGDITFEAICGMKSHKEWEKA